MARPRRGEGPEAREAGIDAAWWRWARPLGGVLVLGALVVVLGTGPFVAALRATDATVLAAGAVIALLTTLCGAWRWRLVARRLGADLTLTAALASCYRAQFLNATLPGGVLGDVGRGVQHGRVDGDVGRGLRGVAWERTAGQVVLVALTAVVLLVARPFDLVPDVSTASAAVVVGSVVAAALLVAVLARWRGGRVTGWLRLVAADLRSLGSGPASLGIVLASLLAVVGHTATFVLAARAVGVRTPVLDLLPLALVVLVMSALPLNLAGWGPREGAAAWVFAAAGLGAASGLATAVAFGAIALVGTLPGAALLLAGRVHRGRPTEPAPAPTASAALGASGLDAVGGGPHG
ncbi:MAG: lysylphosphatidylglycerol synthase transmembrane domain-containing protein [Ornithinibacter sp.]